MIFSILRRCAAVMVILVCVLSTVSAHASTPPTMQTPAGLSMAEIKMTGEEFIILHNNSAENITDLSSYWLTVYNNVNPMSTGVSSSTQQLPEAVLYTGETMLLSANPMQTCGTSVAGELSLSFGDSGGFLQLAKVTLGDTGHIIQEPVDVVSWSSGASGSIKNMPSNTKNPKAVYFRYFTGDSYAWQQADLNPTNICQLNIVVVGGSGSSSAVTPLTLAATSPPATILGIAIAAANSDEVIPQIPSANAGLLAPQISELLPNPAGTGNDSTDEFIELYNPNDRPFDLTGSSLQVGTTTLRSYTFSAETVIPPKTFKAFYAEETKLSLSNTTSQVNLVDPLGNVISVSDTYSKAKDGIGWALAKGKWYWTTSLTPGKANIIQQPAAKKAASTAKKKKVTTKGIAVKGATTKNAANSTTQSPLPEDDVQEGIIHTGVLALIGAAALLYGAYEYRRDIANRLFQLRTKFGIGRTTGSSAEGRRSD